MAKTRVTEENLYDIYWHSGCAILEETSESIRPIEFYNETSLRYGLSSGKKYVAMPNTEMQRLLQSKHNK